MHLACGNGHVLSLQEILYLWLSCFLIMFLVIWLGIVIIIELWTQLLTLTYNYLCNTYSKQPAVRYQNCYTLVHLHKKCQNIQVSYGLVIIVVIVLVMYYCSNSDTVIDCTEGKQLDVVNVWVLRNMVTKFIYYKLS